MSVLIGIICPEAIVLAADSHITETVNGTFSSVDKISGIKFWLNDQILVAQAGLFKVIIILVLIGVAYTIGRAFITGSIQLRGEKEPLRRQDNPQRFKQTMSIITVIFTLIIVILAWMFLVPLIFHSR